jgi:hypothetical protein
VLLISQAQAWQQHADMVAASLHYAGSHVHWLLAKQLADLFGAPLLDVVLLKNCPHFRHAKLRCK